MAETPRTETSDLSDELEDKSLRPDADKALLSDGADGTEQTADPAGPGLVRVVLTQHYRSNGVDYLPGATESFPDDEAGRLIQAKRAFIAE